MTPIKHNDNMGFMAAPSGQPPDGVQGATRRALELMMDSVYFGGLDSDSLAMLAASGHLAHFKHQEIICSPGDLIKGIHLIISGMVDLFLTNSAGREGLIAQLEPGLIFGASSLLHDDHYPCWIRATKPTETVFLPVKDIRDMIVSNPLAMILLETMARRLNFFWQLTVSSGERILPRLATFLLHLPDIDGSVKLPMTKSQLAMRLGITPESLSRSFSRLKQAGIIKAKGNGVAIIDRDRLMNVITEGDLAL